ncbi:MAG TPA: hypothetical protein VMW75_02505, partial [Thermoanaerobaculia bacterium]|nr:hypothetical protein [Thermoanaerobaculia bacterium]
ANTWKYEERARGHVKRWLELSHLFCRSDFEIPVYFRHFFRQLFPTLRKPGATIMDTIKGPEGTRAELEDNIERFLRRIAETRHVALYRSFGEDPHVVEALVNRETTSIAKLGFQAQAVGVFARSLLAETARAVRELITTISVPHDLRPFVYFGAGQPWTDRPRLDLWLPSESREDIEFIKEWLLEVS